MNSKYLVNFVWNHQYFEKLQIFFFFLWGGGGGNFYHTFMYAAPFIEHSLLTLNLPIKVILRFEVVSDVLSENYT